MHSDELLACLFDFADVHLLLEEKVLVLSVNTGEASIEVGWDLGISQNTNVWWETVVDSITVVLFWELANV